MSSTLLCWEAMKHIYNPMILSFSLNRLVGTPCSHSKAFLHAFLTLPFFQSVFLAPSCKHSA